MDLGEVTLEIASPLIGTNFEVQTPEGTTISLTLEDVLPFDLHQRRRSAIARPEPRRQAFSLYFSGPRSQMLKQGMYTFRSEALTLQGLFIVPVAADEKTAEYEAIFN